MAFVFAKRKDLCWIVLFFFVCLCFPSTVPLIFPTFTTIVFVKHIEFHKYAHQLLLFFLFYSFLLSIRDQSDTVRV